MYYEKKLNRLKEMIQGINFKLTDGSLTVDDRIYPIVDDVIILLDKKYWPDTLKQRLKGNKDSKNTGSDKASPKVHAEHDVIAQDIQHTFGAEWSRYNTVLEGYERTFNEYFHLVDLNGLSDKRVCDLGCGTGRYSYFLRHKVAELVLVDFSEAIFVARQNLHDAPNALFFMGDIAKLPFKSDFVDFIFSLGVLHHMPQPCLETVRKLRAYSSELLIYLYYGLDNRPYYFRLLLNLITVVRKIVSKIRNPFFRESFSILVVLLVYLPLIFLGHAADLVGLGEYIPLREQRGKSFGWLQQAVYDRFFTSIEQRVTRQEIYTLKDTFSAVKISNVPGYWTFLCQR